jgi:hypothetical protein
MQLLEQVNAHPDPVTETGTRVEVGDPAYHPGSPRLGWMRSYSRVFGVVQMLYAVLFGYMVVMAYHGGQFYHAEFHGKGDYTPEYLDFEWLISTTALALLSFCCLIGGYGLFRLRPWVRRGEVVYLSVFLVIMVMWMVEDSSKPVWNSDYLTTNIRLFVAFVLPYVPFLFGVAGDAAGASRSR